MIKSEDEKNLMIIKSTTTILFSCDKFVRASQQYLYQFCLKIWMQRVCFSLYQFIVNHVHSLEKNRAFNHIRKIILGDG